MGDKLGLCMQASETIKTDGEYRMSRIDDFINYQRDFETDQDIAAGLCNGDIEKPDWLGISESTDHLKLWDTEDEMSSSSMGFYTLPY